MFRVVGLTASFRIRSRRPRRRIASADFPYLLEALAHESRSPVLLKALLPEVRRTGVPRQATIR